MFACNAKLMIVFHGCCLGLSMSVQGQKDSVVMQAQASTEAVIIGQYAPTNPEKAVHAIQIISAKQIEAMGAQNLANALQFQPNLRLQQDNILGAGLSMQGVGGENVKILVDGVPIIGRQNGQLDLSQILVADVERIEIIEGPLSVQFGTNALAGAINIIRKKKATHFLEGQFNTYYEADGHYNVGGSFGFHQGKHNLTISGGRNFFQGWSPVDTSRNKLWKPKETYYGAWAYSFEASGWELSYRGDILKELIVDRGIPVAPYNEYAFDNYYHTNRLSNTVSLRRQINTHWKAEVQASYSDYKHIRNIYRKDLTTISYLLTENPGDQDTTNIHSLNIRGSLIKTGGKRVNFETGFDINVESDEGDRILDGVKKVGDYALYSSAEWKPIENITIRPGLRYAYNTSYGSPLTPSLNVRWKLGDEATVRASYAKGFRAPGLKELYLDFEDVNHNVVGNPSLIAEASDNLNGSLNIKHVIGSQILKSSVNVYFNDIRNQITLARNPSGDSPGKPLSYQYLNLNRVQTYGTAVQGSWNMDTSLTIGMGAGYTEKHNVFNDQDYFVGSGEINFTIFYRWRNICLFNLFLKYLGKQPDYTMDENKIVSPTFIDSYSLADFTLSKKFFKDKIMMTTGFKNLFDVKNIYAQTAAGVHNMDSGTASVGTGRNFFIKLSFGFAVL